MSFSDGNLLALASKKTSHMPFPVGLLHQIHVHVAHFNNHWSLMGRSDRLWLLWNYSTSILSTIRDVLVHSLVFLFQQIFFVVTRIIVFEEKLELFFFYLLG